MNYYISRGNQQYGPYSLADLQRYVQQGNIALNDLTRSDGMTDWVPVSQVLGNIGMPPATPYGAQAGYNPPSNPYGTPVTPNSATPSPSYGAPAAYGAPGGYGAVPQPGGFAPPPPSMHWGVLLLITIVSCGLFGWVWAFVEAAWVKKIRPQNNAVMLYIIGLCLSFGGPFIGAMVSASVHGDPGLAAVGSLVSLGGSLTSWVLIVMAAFSIKAALEDYYNREEPIGLRLSGVMTFFFAIFYFQYHFTRINEMKQRAAMQQGIAAGGGQFYGR